MAGFENDILHRKRFAINLTTILKNSDKHLINDNNSLVIALDSPWGTGKTKFLNEWKKLLKDDTFEILDYNAWESDYSEDALMPIINAIYEQKSFEDKREKLKEKTVDILKYVGKNVAKNFVSEKFGKELVSILSLVKKHGLDDEELKNILKENSTNEYYDDFLEFKKVKKNFTDFLQKLSRDKKILFFIDELDRCKPTFAIQTLEIIKHFFNIKNFVFVIALDMEQLSQSIKTIYGQNMDTCGYLRRFFDLHFKIPKPKIKDYVTFVLKNNILGYIVSNEFVENISNIFHNLDLSLREINSILENYKLVLETSLRPYIENKEYVTLESYLYLITLKYKEPYYYNVILYKRFIEQGNEVGRVDKLIIVPKNIFEPTTDIKNFLELIQCGNNDKVVNEFSGEVLLKLWPYLGCEINAHRNIKVNQYIEEQIEIFNYVNTQ